jgi:peptide/nickel transport system substrate-binding protein
MKLARLMGESRAVRTLVVVIATLLALCVGPANAASEPGTVTILLIGEPENLDSADSIRNLDSQVTMRNVFEPLVEINPDDRSVVPRLATSWKQIDATTWHFFLR